MGAPSCDRYERVTFEKELVASRPSPWRSSSAPGTRCSTRRRPRPRALRPLLKQGAVLVDPTDEGEEPQAARLPGARDPGRRTIGVRRAPGRLAALRVRRARRRTGRRSEAGYAPYLDYRPSRQTRRSSSATCSTQVARVTTSSSSRPTTRSATAARAHLEEVRRRTARRVERTTKAVKERLEAEIRHWDHRANQLKEQELAGKQPRMNSGRARERADELQARMKLGSTSSRARSSSPRCRRSSSAARWSCQPVCSRGRRGRARQQSRPPCARRPNGSSGWPSMRSWPPRRRSAGRHGDAAEQQGLRHREPNDADGDLLFIEVKGRMGGADGSRHASEILTSGSTRRITSSSRSSIRPRRGGREP